MKTLKIEYFILPVTNKSHIGEYLYRVRQPKESKWSKWINHTLPLKILQDDLLFSRHISDLVSEYGIDKVKSYECKLVRKNGRKN